MYRIFCIAVLGILSLSVLRAQPKSIGPTFSYAGIGLIYEHNMDDSSFAEVQVRCETASYFADASRKPGVSASFTWNLEFAEIESRNGNRISFFAGPGAMAGLAEDLDKGTGVIFGMKGRIGGECTFRRNVCISFSISPVLGFHMGTRDGMLNMLLYTNGLLYGIMPEVGIKYAF